jgi:hypothetical protein
MIAALLSVLGSSAVGSILGGIFAFLNRKVDMESKRMDLDHEKQRWAHDLVVKDKDLEYVKLEAQGRKDVAIIEGEATVEAARFTAVAAAQSADRVTAEEIQAAGKFKWMLVAVGAFNRTIRPSATIVLSGAAIYINLLLMSKLTEAWPTLSPAQQLEVSMQALAWLTGQAGAALGYWFVARGSSK